jgi:hypothetical protein
MIHAGNPFTTGSVRFLLKLASKAIYSSSRELRRFFSLFICYRFSRYILPGRNESLSISSQSSQGKQKIDALGGAGRVFLERPLSFTLLTGADECPSRLVELQTTVHKVETKKALPVIAKRLHNKVLFTLPWLLSSLPLYPQLFVRDSPDGIPIHALDCAVGTMPPFGNLYGLTRYVDKSLTHEDCIVFESCTHIDAIKLSYQDL